MTNSLSVHDSATPIGTKGVLVAAWFRAHLGDIALSVQVIALEALVGARDTVSGAHYTAGARVVHVASGGVAETATVAGGRAYTNRVGASAESRARTNGCRC